MKSNIPPDQIGDVQENLATLGEAIRGSNNGRIYYANTNDPVFFSTTTNSRSLPDLGLHPSAGQSVSWARTASSQNVTATIDYEVE